MKKKNQDRKNSESEVASEVASKVVSCSLYAWSQQQQKHAAVATIAVVSVAATVVVVVAFCCDVLVGVAFCCFCFLFFVVATAGLLLLWFLVLDFSIFYCC